jgi:hypothetical protein
VGDNPISRIDPLGLWTVQIGGTINIQLGPINFQTSGGIAFDGYGNIGGYSAYGGGIGEGAQVSGGLNLNSGNANTICDLNGPFTNVSAGGGWGPSASGDAYYGYDSQGNRIEGGGITIGVGAGEGGSTTITTTTVTPVGKLW